MPLSARASPFTGITVAAFSSQFTPSAWKSSLSSSELLQSRPSRTLQYRGRTLVQTFTPDFMCYDNIIFEIKAVSAPVDEHRAQVLNDLSASGCKLGPLVNFGHYPNWNTNGSSAETKNLPMFISKMFVSFHVFRGPEK